MSFADETWLLWIMNRKRPPTAATITKCDNQFLQALYRARFFPFSFCLLLVTVLTCVCFMCVSSVDKSRWPFRRESDAVKSRMRGIEKDENERNGHEGTHRDATAAETRRGWLWKCTEQYQAARGLDGRRQLNFSSLRGYYLHCQAMDPFRE